MVLWYCQVHKNGVTVVKKSYKVNFLGRSSKLQLELPPYPFGNQILVCMGSFTNFISNIKQISAN